MIWNSNFKIRSAFGGFNLGSNLNYCRVFCFSIDKSVGDCFNQTNSHVGNPLQQHFQYDRKRFGQVILVLPKSPLTQTSEYIGRARHSYSHSIVAGGLLLISYTTRLTPDTWLMMRVE